MAKGKPRAGESQTLNYGWTKPTVGASDDLWGGLINADLDGIDTTVKAVSTVANAAYPATNPAGYQTAAQVTAAVPAPSSTPPVMDGTAAVGSGTTYARADHAHPSDTTKYNASNPSGYQTAAQVTASLGNYLPLSGGTVTGFLGVSGGLTMTGTTPNLIWHYLDNSLLGQIGYQGASQQGWNNTPAATWLYLNSDGSFSYFGGGDIAVKTGGGSWTAASDARIKTVEGAWTPGLDEVLQLEPVVYRYKGNDAEPGKTSPHAHVAGTQKAFVGLIAQAAETVLPDMVTQGKGWIDGAEVDDFRNLDPSTLVYALINAVKELKAEIDAIKTPPPAARET